MTALILLSDWQKSQVEFWRKTKYDGYDVSNFGRVRSWWVKVANKGSRKGFRTERESQPHITVGSKDSYGYRYIEFGKRDGKRRRVWFHRLVIQTFVENLDSLPEINHRNAIKIDNRLDNLEWVSSKANVQHAALHGLREKAKFQGERSWKTSLTENDVREIRRRADSGEKLKDIAKDFCVGLAGVKHIAARHSWKHVE